MSKREPRTAIEFKLTSGDDMVVEFKTDVGNAGFLTGMSELKSLVSLVASIERAKSVADDTAIYQAWRELQKAREAVEEVGDKNHPDYIERYEVMLAKRNDMVAVADSVYLERTINDE